MTEEKLLTDIDPCFAKYYLDPEGNMIVETTYHIIMDGITEEDQREWHLKSIQEFDRRVKKYLNTITLDKPTE